MGEQQHSSLTSMMASRAANTAASSLVSGIANRLMGNRSPSSEQTIHLEKYLADARSLVSLSQSLADELNHAKTTPLHLLYRIVEQPEMEGVFQQLKVDTGSLASAIKQALDALPKNSSKEVAYLASEMIDLLCRAEKNAGPSKVGLDHLLLALSHEIRGTTGNILQGFNLLPGCFTPLAPTLKSMTLKTTNNSLGVSYVKDLVAAARNNEFGPTIGRETEIRRLLQVLCRGTKNHPLLVAEPGTGKTTVVRGIAQRFANDEIPPTLINHSFVEVDLNALQSGTKSRNEVEERIKQILSNYSRADHKAILVMEGVENLLGQSSLTSILDFFKTLLKRDDAQVFATTTTEGLRKINEKDATLVRYFTVVNMEAPTPDQAVEVLRGIAPRFEKHHSVRISDPAIRAAVSLAKRYVQDKMLPDSAVDILDEASARKRVEMTGMPADLDRDIQRLVSLKAQQNKLLNDNDPQGNNDPQGQRTLEKINQEILELEPKVENLKGKIDRRRKVVSTRGEVIVALEKAQKELEEAKSNQNWPRVAQLEHSVLPDLKDKMERVEKYYAETEVNDDADVVNENDVAQVVGEATGIPVNKMMEDEAGKLVKMPERITQRVIGQDEAVSALSRAVQRSRVGLRDPRRPIGSFLFLGPSGVGKTEISKALAEFLFDDEQAMIRVDCSELGEKHTVAKLLGSPVGYEGSSEGGMLVNQVRRRPYSVFLFDEVEKAHPDVFNILLQVLDEGSLTDSRGNRGDFSNVVVVMTSNIGSKRILDADPVIFESEEGREAMNDVLRTELKAFFRPEFLNRIDEVITFRALTKGHLRSIVDLELRKVERLMSSRDLKLQLTERAKAAIVDASFDAPMGARPLRRTILKRIQDPLAATILSNGIRQGATINVDVNDGGEFIFS